MAMVCSLAVTARADEQAAIEAVRKAGGTVSTVAHENKLKEVSFHLRGKDATDPVLAQVAAIPDVGWLNLSSTKITDAGLADVGKIKTLTRLHLELTGIGDAGLAHLTGLENLEYLNLYGTQVTDVGLAHLKGLKKLKNVYLWQSQVTPAGAEALAKAMPELNVVTGIKVATPASAKTPPTKSLAKGQLVRVRLVGDGKILSLAEVEIFQTGDGAALHRAGKATQSSVLGGTAGASRAIDGDMDQQWQGNSVTHTNTEANPWWMVDLGGVKDIGRIRILNRGDAVGERLEGAIVEVLEPGATKVAYTTTITGAKTGSIHVLESK